MGDPFRCANCGKWFDELEWLDEHKCPAKPTASKSWWYKVRVKLEEWRKTIATW